jgi:hypothetical protein
MTDKDWHRTFDDPIPCPAAVSCASCAMPDTSSPGCRGASTMRQHAAPLLSPNRFGHDLSAPWDRTRRTVHSKMVARPKGKYADFRIIGFEAVEQK